MQDGSLGAHDEKIIELTKERDNALSDWKQADADSIRAIYERNEAREALAQVHKELGHELRDPNGTIWDECSGLSKELTKARAQRDHYRTALERIAGYNHELFDRRTPMWMRDVAEDALMHVKGGKS